MDNFENEEPVQLDYPDDVESLDNYESEEEKIMNLENPLSIINPDADLDAILAARSIGDAIQILCPKIPGLPSKTRGKYRKRRMMTLDAKTQMMKDQNKENARRTRRRKKLYDIFLARVIAALEEVLNPRDDSENNNGLSTSSSAINNFSKNISHNSLHSNEGGQCETINKPGFQQRIGISSDESENVFKAQRIEYLSKYLMMRVSAQASSEPWLTICSPTIVNSMPIPIYRFGQVQSKKPNWEHLGRCELRGINALIEDTESQINFIISLLHSRGKQSYGWTIEAELHPETSILGGGSDSLCMWYDYQVYEVPSTAGTEKFTKASWTKLLRIPVKTNIKYDVDNRISYVFDEFDVFHILRQYEAVANIPNSERALIGRNVIPVISTKDTIAANPKIDSLLPNNVDSGKTECLNVTSDSAQKLPENNSQYNHESKDNTAHPPSQEHPRQSNYYRFASETQFGRDFPGENHLYEQHYQPPPHYYPMNSLSRYLPPYGQYSYTGHNYPPEPYPYLGDMNVNTQYSAPGRYGYPYGRPECQDNAEGMRTMWDPTLSRNPSIYSDNRYRTSSSTLVGSHDYYYNHPKGEDTYFERDVDKRYNNYHEDNNYKKFPMTSHEQDDPFLNDLNEDYNSYNQRKYRYYSRDNNYYTSETSQNYPRGTYPNNDTIPSSLSTDPPPMDESTPYRRPRNDSMEREYYHNDRCSSNIRTENVRNGNKITLEDNYLEPESENPPQSNSSIALPL